MDQKKKAFLENYRLLNRRIEQKLSEQERWKTLAAKLDDAKKRGDFDLGCKSVQISEKLIVLEREIEQEIDQLIYMRNRIEDAINQMKNNRYKLLLFYRYMDSMTWEKIAEKMDYSYQWVHKIHAQALEDLKLEEESG